MTSDYEAHMSSPAIPTPLANRPTVPPTRPNGFSGTRHPHYQEIKSRIHSDLLNRLNLDRLTTVKREDAEPEIRDLIGSMLDFEARTTPLSLAEREQLVTDTLNELFGLGPLEELLHDPTISDILVNCADQ